MADPNFFLDLWETAKQAGPFASMFLLLAVWVLNNERKAERAKYDSLVARFVELAGDTGATLRDWRNILIKEQERK